MKRLLPFLALIAFVALLIPVLAVVEAARVKEPNAIFAYEILNEGDEAHVRAVLFDRERRKVIDRLDVETGLPIYGGAGIESNDNMQFSPATGKIYAVVTNFSEHEGYGRTDTSLPYDSAIIETDFAFRKPTPIFSCDNCSIDQWVVHPSDAKLYVSIADAFTEEQDEFSNAKLIEVITGEKPRTRVLTRIPGNSALHVTPDGRTLYTFHGSEKSRFAWGKLISVNLRSNRRKTDRVVNFPFNSYGKNIRPGSFDVSPNLSSVAYHFGKVNVRTSEAEEFEAFPYDIHNFIIGWSRDSRKLLFQLTEDIEAVDRDEVPLHYDSATGREWAMPLEDVNLIKWSPAQTAILFQKTGVIGFYDLIEKEWVDVFENTLDYASRASWLTMSTKKK